METNAVYVDGGCLGNGTAHARTYGSYQLGGRIVRVELKGVTNNQAEYMTLIAALTHAATRGMRDFTVRTDSQLVVEQVNGRWKVKKPELRPLCDNARELLKGCGARLEWVGRDVIVAILGH